MRFSAQFIKDIKSGDFLTPPDSAKTTLKDGNEVKTWFETFQVAGIVATVLDDGTELVRIDVTVPHDVQSANQGRRCGAFFRFPQGSDDGQEQQRTISARSLFSLFAAAGYDPDTSTGFDTSSIDGTALAGQRVTAQVRIAPDKNGIPRQNLQYWKAPK